MVVVYFLVIVSIRQMMVLNQYLHHPKFQKLVKVKSIVMSKNTLDISEYEDEVLILPYSAFLITKIQEEQCLINMIDSDYNSSSHHISFIFYSAST
jgi:hypothetical protein